MHFFRPFASRNHYSEILYSYPETSQYLKIPDQLSDPAFEIQYGAYSEHVMLSLNRMFWRPDTFPHLTEIVLGREVINTSLQMTGENGKHVSTNLFRSLGIACPNLKVKNPWTYSSE